MLILASASPRRRELLSQAGLNFTVAAADINEDLSAERSCGRVCPAARRGEGPGGLERPQIVGYGRTTR